jgi:HK97 gp10 family phage protein
MSSFRAEFDGADAVAGLEHLAERVQAAVRPAAQAGAQVLYDDVRARVPQDTGLLHSAIYQAFADGESTEERVTYRVSWNRSKAWYGRLVEFGTVKMAARPFIRPAFDAAHKRALEAAQRKFIDRVQGVDDAAGS